MILIDITVELIFPDGYVTATGFNPDQIQNAVDLYQDYQKSLLPGFSVKFTQTTISTKS